MSRCQFALGDHALEIEPMQSQGGAHGPDRPGVRASLQTYADDLGISVETVEAYRWVCSRWPKERRKADVPYYIHRALAGMSDPNQRFAAIEAPPVDERTGLRRWTEAAVKQEAGRQFADRATVKQKIDRIHDLARDEKVAAAVATDLLRRPAVAAQVVTDDTARHLVNRAQADQARQAALRRSPQPYARASP